MLADDTERSRYSRCTAQTCCVKPIVSSNVDSLAARRMRVHPCGVTAPGSISARSSCPTTAYTSVKARATADTIFMLWVSQAELMFRVCQATRYFLIGVALRRLEYQLEWVLLVSNQGQDSPELPALYSGAADRKQCAADLHALLLTLPTDCSDQQGTRLHLR